ncbi:DUF3291 domain-containing protein [Streptomyces sp. NPDC006552]|uniref:DUF3291 domain-containing protein n=1 Tax=Streptomyces sp. NPDC006552 TaxID=3157179 RepID=UPI0033B74B8C
MPRLALYTFGVLKSPLADPGPLMREFHDSSGDIYRRFSEHPGYLGHAEAAEGERYTLFDSDWGVWGEFAVPAWYGKGRTGETAALAATLSLWTGVRPARDAVYTGLHRTALNRRHDWFERTGRPGHVFWWVPDDAVPTWQDGVRRLEHLDGHGAAPDAFTFRHAFTAEGAAATPAR